MNEAREDGLSRTEEPMDEVETGQPASPEPPRDAKAMLRAARAASGLTLAEVASRTRVPVRHLEALEVGDYASLPSPTYAVGFARAHARATGSDEVAIARQVRAELDRLGPRVPQYVPYETADPARVPSRGIAIAGAGMALAVLILFVLFYGTNLFRGGPPSSAAPATDIAAAPIAPAPAASPTPAPPTGGQVTLTATDEVWLRVYDADDKTLYLGTMKPGDRYDVPAGANDPMINVGRPDKLQVTLNGSQVPPLGTGERPIKDVRVSGAAVAARLNGEPAPGASTPPAVASDPLARAPSATAQRASQPAKPAPRLTETQRANLASARALRNARN
jgi:cytoskeleton protein RodZ